MKPFEISTFKWGLDTRRDVLTSQLGTLLTLENGHINPGGEIEKRKAFVAQQDLSIFETTTYTISSITRVSYTATATTAANHQLSNGDWVKVSGAVQSAYNGEFQVSNVTATTFDYTIQSTTVATPATGTPVFTYLGPYGLEVTSVGLVTFGSALIYGSGTSITSITRSGSTATATKAGHGLSNGDVIFVSGADQSEYNGAFTVSNVTASTFDYTVSGTPATPATGTIIFNRQSQPLLEAAIPSGVTYQQLQHPSIYNDTTETYDRTRHRLTKVVFSSNFNGNAFVIALFSDGRRFLYYDGDLVQHSANGLVMTGRTDLADLAKDLERQVEVIGWDATPNVDESGNNVTQNGAVLIKSPAQDYFQAELSETSSAGSVGFKQILKPDDTPAVDEDTTPALRAIASFKVNAAAAGTIQLEAPAQKTATTPTVDLCGGAVAVTGATQTTANKIAQYVNDLTSVHGYSAKSDALFGSPDSNVFIYAPPEFDLTVALVLTVTEAGGATTTTATATANGLHAFVEPNPVTKRVEVLPGGGNVIVTESATCFATGGSAPGNPPPTYSYAWSERTGGTGGGITIQAGSESQATAVFSASIPRPTGGAGNEVSGQFKCVVTAGGGGGTVTVFLVVRFEVELA